jgi:hypothetical protein
MTNREMREAKRRIGEAPPDERHWIRRELIHQAEQDKKSLETELEAEAANYWDWVSVWRGESRTDAAGLAKPVRRLPEDEAGFKTKAIAAVISGAADVALSSQMFELVRWPWYAGATLGLIATVVTHAGLSSLYHVFRPPHQDPTPPDRLRKAKRGTKWFLGAVAAAGVIAAVSRTLTKPLIPLPLFVAVSDLGLVVATVGLVALAAHFGVQAQLYGESGRRRRKCDTLGQEIAAHETFVQQLRSQEHSAQGEP